MDKQIHSFPTYSLWEICENHLYDIIRFVVETNYKHHIGSFPALIENEIEEIYLKEKTCFDNSRFFALKNNENETVGSIRILQCDKNTKIATESIYSEYVEALTEPYNMPKTPKKTFHIGRLAINRSLMGITSIMALKILLANTAKVAYEEEGSVLLAELDKKLFDKLGLLDLNFSQIGNSYFDIGSETVPAFISSQHTRTFLEKHKHLCHV